jgi:ABC-2 type transport system ATP-binding protein
LEAILQLDQLFGGYFFRKPFLQNISFSIQKGEMVGLIGLNGAGKSTTIKNILGLLKPQQGQIRIKGIKLEESPQVYRSSFAYVPETPELYEELTIQEHLELTALAYGIEKSDLEQRSQRLAKLFQMEAKMKSFPAHLSKGMKQKVMIMNAFLIEPPLYIIDEPFLGLDPLSIRALLELMVEVKKTGASFLISSHILSTIEKYCDRFIVMHQGKMIAYGTLDEIRKLAKMSEASLDDLFCKLVGSEDL